MLSTRCLINRQRNTFKFRVGSTVKKINLRPVPLERLRAYVDAHDLDAEAFEAGVKLIEAKHAGEVVP